MQVNTREARRQLSRLIKAVERGERVEITRRGRVVAQLSAPEEHPGLARSRASARASLRERLPVSSESSSQMIRELREERG
jgi:prevent-host-death family protein